MRHLLLNAIIWSAAMTVANAQEAACIYPESVTLAEHRQESHGAAEDPWTRLYGCIFRRYAGSVEMESKTPYPAGYYGRFTYLPWKPDWVRTPENSVRASRYRHHHHNDSLSGEAIDHSLLYPTVTDPHSEMQWLPNSPAIEQPTTLNEVELQSLR